VVEAWDRRLVAAYLENLLSPVLLESGKVCSGIALPPAGLSHAQVLAYIEAKVPIDGVGPLGLNGNAEAAVSLRASEALAASLASLQPQQVVGEAVSTPIGGADRVTAALEFVLESLPTAIPVDDVRAAAVSAPGQDGSTSADPGPFAMVVLRECDRMNSMLKEIRGSLAELALGLKGDLSMSEEMDAMVAALSADRVPSRWASMASPSLRPLRSWVQNLIACHTQLVEWAANPSALPPVVWLPGLFDPMSFLTAVQQQAARKAGWALDATVLTTEVTRKAPAQIDVPPREGAYIHGLWLEGAGWDERAGCLEEARHKASAMSMPVMHVRGVPVDKAPSTTEAYMCPVYVTEARFRQEVFSVPLRVGRQAAARWATAGVAMILDMVPF